MKKPDKTILKRLYTEGQKERLHTPTSPVEIRKNIQRDKKRKYVAKSLYEKGQILTGADLFYAAMIFHHGTSIADAKMALRLAKMSMEKGFKKAFWLYAGATDRLLMKQKKAQKYGTQFFKKSKKHEWVLYKTDPRVSDKERALYNVPPLSEAKKELLRMNKK